MTAPGFHAHPRGFGPTHGHDHGPAHPQHWHDLEGFEWSEPVTASQTSTGVDALPAERATTPSAQQGTNTGGPQ